MHWGYKEMEKEKEKKKTSCPQGVHFFKIEDDKNFKMRGTRDRTDGKREGDAILAMNKGIL